MDINAILRLALYDMAEATDRQLAGTTERPGDHYRKFADQKYGEVQDLYFYGDGDGSGVANQLARRMKQEDCAHVWSDNAPECTLCHISYFEVNPLTEKKDLPF